MKLSKRHIQTALMVAPYLIGLSLLVIAPALVSVGFVFTEYDAFAPPHWMGLTQLRALWTDRLVLIVVGNTLFYVVAVVALRLVGAFALALLLYRRSRANAIVRPLVYLPTVIPEVAYALIWLVAFNPRFGPINLMMSALHLPAPDWLIAPWPTRWALVIMAAWQLGEGFIVLLVSLRDVPAALYETAEIDGAGRMARFRHITLPLLLPYLLLLITRDVVMAIQASFVPSLVMTGGGPGYATLFVPLYTYFLAFEDFRFGYASTLIWTMYGLSVALLLLPYYIVRRSGRRGDFAL